MALRAPKRGARMTVRYIADTHFGHDAILAYDNRPFNSVSEMDRTIIERWNAVVAPEDLTYILGDFCAAGPERWAELLSSLNGEKALIRGNHDDPGTVEAVRPLLADVSEYREILDGERHVVLCHYPMLSFHNQYFGWYHLYGHVHTAFEWNITENCKRLIRNLYVRDDVCRMANVGAMLPYMDYTPRTLDELQSVL